MSDVTQTNCPICGSQATEQIFFKALPSGDYEETIRYECIRCGEFDLDGFSEVYTAPSRDGYLGEMGSRKRADLSAWLREKTDQRERRGGDIGKIVKLENSFLTTYNPNDLRDAFEAATITRFHEKADRLLLALRNASKYVGQPIGVFASEQDNLAWQARAWAMNAQELKTIVNHLVENGLIAVDQSPSNSEQMHSIRLLGKGIERIEQQNPGNINSDQCFVAMWFNDEVLPVFNDALAPAIEKAGYKPFKINDKPPVDRVDAEIEKAIKASRFMVADLSKHRPSVYFEAGYARSQGIPVFFTCREEDFDELHFDIRQFHCFKWSPDNPGKIVDELNKMIVRECGRGPV